jgi:hypothetical protein
MENQGLQIPSVNKQPQCIIGQGSAGIIANTVVRVMSFALHEI